MHGLKKKLLENINIDPLMYFYSILFPCANNYEDLSLQIQKNHLILFNFQKFTALMYHLALFVKYYTVFGEDEPRAFRRSKPKILARSEKYFRLRLRCSDTVRGLNVTINSNLMRYLDTVEGI